MQNNFFSGKLYIFCGERCQKYHKRGVFFCGKLPKNQFFFCFWKPRKADVILVWAKFTLYPKWRKVRSICTPPKFHQIYLHAYIHVFSPNICSFTSNATMSFVFLFVFFASQLNASLSELIKLFKKLLWNSEISVSRYGWFPIEKSCMNGASIL